MEIVYPHVLSPTPSVAIVQFQPDLTEGSLSDGFLIPRDTALRGKMVKGEQTQCEFRTSHEVTMWPLEISQAEYFSREVADMELPDRVRHAEAGLRMRLRIAPGHRFDELAIENLPIYLRGAKICQWHCMNN